MTKDDSMALLSKQTGLSLSFNKSGVCRLRFDSRLLVDLEAADDDVAVYLYLRLGSLATKPFSAS